MLVMIDSRCLPSLVAWFPSVSWATPISWSSGWAAISSRQAFMLMLLSVNWVVMNWDRDNMWLNDERIWNFNRHMDRERNFHFLNNWNFDLFVDWKLRQFATVIDVDTFKNFIVFLPGYFWTWWWWMVCTW